MPMKFFITHSWDEKSVKFVKRFAEDLKANGFDGFLDIYSIQPGENILKEMQQGLEMCDVYLPILSFASLTSSWYEFEINAAITLSLDTRRNRRPRIVPILIENCFDEMPIFLRPFLIINFTNRYDDGLREVLEKVFGVSPKTDNFHSVFISHSAKDKHFCERLYADLQATEFSINNVHSSSSLPR